LYIETAQNYYDLLSRLSGRNIAGRKKVGGKKAVVIIGQPVLVSRGVDPSKTQSKAVIDSLTEKLTREYRECIKEIRGIRGAGAQGQTRGGGA
jgi:hypothetical protein